MKLYIFIIYCRIDKIYTTYRMLIDLLNSYFSIKKYNKAKFNNFRI